MSAVIEITYDDEERIELEKCAIEVIRFGSGCWVNKIN